MALLFINDLHYSFTIHVLANTNNLYKDIMNHILMFSNNHSYLLYKIFSYINFWQGPVWFI